jgi:F-type H+-transporting ATPase subunit delta
MAHFPHIARPYARAAFDCAREKNELHAWRIFLEQAAYVATQPEVVVLINRPTLAAAQLLNIFEVALANTLNVERKHFLTLLTEKRRLVVLPDILQAFHAHEEELEKQSTVRVVTATPIKEPFKKSLTAALTKRLQREVHLKHEIDPAIVGGARIHIGDQVIDSSIRTQLTRLLEHLR